MPLLEAYARPDARPSRVNRWSIVLDLGRDPNTGRRIRKWHSGYMTRKAAEKARIELLHRLEHGTYAHPTKETGDASKD